MTRWYRAYEGTVTDAKLGEVALIAECSRSVAIAAWHAVLEDCASFNEGGRFQITARRLAVILAEPVALMASVLNGFEELGMTQGGFVTAWKQRQFESDLSTERSRKLRERRRNGDATLHGRFETPPETETETELEKAPSVAFSNDSPEPLSTASARAALPDARPAARAAVRKAVEVPAPDVSPQRVFVAFDTPEWTAWANHLRALGKTPHSPSSKFQDANGWWFPSASPPAEGRAA